MHHSFHSKRLASLLALSLVAAASAAMAVNGPGSLYVAGATHTPTHWNIPIGVQTCAEIRGVGSEVGNPLPATITVIIKSSEFGNTNVVGTRVGTTSNYSFCWTPPAIENGADFNACGTTIVAYVSNGRNTNNDLIDDGVRNGSSNAAAGLRFVDAAGRQIECINLGVGAAPWSGMKQLYR
jgi:hypothetical protein